MRYRLSREVLAAFLVLAGSLASLGQAGEEAEEVLPSVGVDMAVMSRYVWRGLLLTDDPVLQPSLTVGYAGVSLNVWGNMDLGSVNDNEGDFNEVDFTLSYEHTYKKASFSGGLIHYTFPNTDFASTTEVFASVSLDVPLAPTFAGYWDADEVQGTYLTFDLSHSVPLPKIRDGLTWSLDLSAGVGWGSPDHNEGYFGAEEDGVTDFRAGLSLPISVGEHWTITPGVNYSTVLDDDLEDAIDGDSDHVVAGITVSFSF